MVAKRKQYDIILDSMWAKHRRKRLQKYVRKYFLKYPLIKLIVVTGSIGKTQAKVSIATVLSSALRVRLFHGNRGTNFTTPLAVLGIDYPSDIKGFRAWHKIFKAARKRIKQPQDVDVVVLELNASHVGSLVGYASYLVPDIAVVTAVSESNIRVFQSIDQVAREQLSIGTISRELLINRDDIDGRFSEYLTNGNMSTYGIDGSSEYRFEQSDYTTKDGFSGSIYIPGWQEAIPVVIPVHDEFTLRQAVVACGIGAKLGMSSQSISSAATHIYPLTGHMCVLDGVKGSTLLDDTANTSPLGAKTALRALYATQAPQKVAVLGSMRRLGQFSQAAHREIGSLCDPVQLAWVVTVGDEANRWLAPAARGRGCQVKECATALEAGAFINSVIEQEALVLFNGHEDDFLEESLKIVLRSQRDVSRLVRQDAETMAKKADMFSLYA